MRLREGVLQILRKRKSFPISRDVQDLHTDLLFAVGVTPGWRFHSALEESQSLRHASAVVLFHRWLRSRSSILKGSRMQGLSHKGRVSMGEVG